jgi:hypothetical protein
VARTTTITKPAKTRPGYVRLRSVPKSTANSNIRRLRLREPERCKRKRWTDGTSHLAMVNSRCAHGLQWPFSAQPKAIARLARKTRSRRLETSISLNGWVTSWASGSRSVLARCPLRAAPPSLVSNSCRAVKRGEDLMNPYASFRDAARRRNCRH